MLAAQARGAAAPAAVEARVESLLAKLTLEQKIELLGGVDGFYTHAAPSIGLPRLKMSDGPLGVRTWGATTGYAAGIGLAATWDPGLARRVGVGMGRDARARGVNFLLGPGVNIYRLPLNGRNFEYYGEDPFLAGQTAAGLIRGVQSQGVVATVKHFTANNSEYDRHQVNSVIDERTLREIYLPAFEAAVKQGHVGAVMDSYNLLNGVHTTQNRHLNVDILKGDWGFRGLLMSDWTDTYDTVNTANNGLDLEMPDPRFLNQRTLLPAIKAGEVSVATIDDKVRRLLRLAVTNGWLDRPQLDTGIPLYDQQSRQAALQSAEESMVLLKNEGGLLPVDPHRVHSIAVIGPNAYPAVPSAGGSAEITAFDPVSFLTGISDAAGSTMPVYWNAGVRDLHSIFGAAGFNGGSFSVDAQATRPGLKQERFANDDLSGPPEDTKFVSHIDSWQGSLWAGPPQHKTSYRWSGFYTPKTGGPQTFIVAGIGRDSYRLFVDDKQVLQQPLREGQAPEAVNLDLPAGHPAAIRLEYVQGSESPTLGFGVVPAAEMLDPEARKLAARADLVVLAVGFNPRTESEGFDRSYQLPPGQDELIRTVLAANPHSVVVLTAGGSVDTHRWIAQTPALLHTWYAGQEGGRALADVLLGRVNPSGKLPISFEKQLQDEPAFPNYYEAPGSHDAKYAEGVFIGYRYFDQAKTKPLFPFGFGLSYTSFAFSHLVVTPDHGTADTPIQVSFDVRNTGSRAGADVAQLYVGDPSATVPRPVKELKGFERVNLAPGATRHVTLKLNRRSLAYWDTATSWKVDPGKFIIYVGDSSVHVPLQATYQVK